MTPADWDKVRSVVSTASWRGFLVRSAVRTVAAGGELHHVLRGMDWRARDLYRAHYSQYFGAEVWLLRLLRTAAVCGAPHGPRGQRRTRTDLLKQAKRIEAAFVDAAFYAKDTDEDAARDCVRISMGLVHHLVSGTPLPADCSIGSDW
jgi:hypothetical protein